MRQFTSSSFIAAAAIVLIASSASALSSVHSFTDLTGLGTDGTVLGNTLGDLEVGDRFEVGIALDNSSGDGIFGVFTHLKYDNNVINIVEGLAVPAAFPPEGGFVGNRVFILAAPEDAAAQPAGTSLSIALSVSNPATDDGLYSRDSSAAIAVAIFEVVGAGTTTIEHVDTGYTIFNGSTQPPTFSAPLQVVVSDVDGDFVADSLDNCSTIPNGPNEGGLNQLDGDLDGYGNACDADFNNDGVHNGLDFTPFINSFNAPSPIADLTGDGVVNGLDFGPFIALFNTAVGPSGLSCAGMIPCTP